MKSIINKYRASLVTLINVLIICSCNSNLDSEFLQIKDEDVQISLITESINADSVSFIELIVDIDPSVHQLIDDSISLHIEPYGFFQNKLARIQSPIEHLGQNEFRIYSKQIGSSQLSINIGNGIKYSKWIQFNPSYPDGILLKTNSFKYISQIGAEIDFTIKLNKVNGGRISENIQINVYLLDSLNEVTDELWLRTNSNDEISDKFTLIDSVYKGRMGIKATMQNGNQELLEQIKSIELE